MAKFSKAVYEATAEALAAAQRHVDERPATTLVTAQDALTYVRGYLGRTYEMDNPKFDLARFDAACTGDRA